MACSLLGIGSLALLFNRAQALGRLPA